MNPDDSARTLRLHAVCRASSCTTALISSYRPSDEPEREMLVFVRRHPSAGDRRAAKSLTRMMNGTLT